MDSRHRYRSRRRTARQKQTSEPNIDKFSVLVIGQSIVCGIIFLLLLTVKLISAEFYESIETGIAGSKLIKSDLSDVNSKIAQVVNKNPYISKMLGKDGAVTVFSWFKGKSKSESSSLSVSFGSSDYSGSESLSSLVSGSDSSQSGSSLSSVSNSYSDSNSSKSSSPKKSTVQTSDTVGGIGAGLADGNIFQYDFMDSVILKAYGINGEIEEEDIIIEDRNTKALPKNVSLKKVNAPEKVYKPVSAGRITSGFDFRDDPFSDNYTFHTGIDIGIASGSTVRAAMSGTVIAVGYSSVGGNYVKIEHKKGFVTYYGHLKKATVKEGNKVKANAKIGLSGNTGKSTGPHLHFEIRHNGIYLNPEHYIKV